MSADRPVTDPKLNHPSNSRRTKLCNICRVNRVPVGVHACEVCE